MQTIDEMYLSSRNIELVSKPTAIDLTGDPKAEKTTPTNPRVKPDELELTYLHNPTIFNGVNKIVQTIMSADHIIEAKRPNSEKHTSTRLLLIWVTLDQT